jgi:hypothetical protein
MLDEERGPMVSIARGGFAVSILAAAAAASACHDTPTALASTDDTAALLEVVEQVPADQLIEDLHLSDGQRHQFMQHLDTLHSVMERHRETASEDLSALSEEERVTLHEHLIGELETVHEQQVDLMQTLTEEQREQFHVTIQKHHDTAIGAHDGSLDGLHELHLDTESAGGGHLGAIGAHISEVFSAHFAGHGG